jgi:hypothetical protein
MLSVLLYERTERSKRRSRTIGKDAFMRTHRFDLGYVAHCHWPTPPPLRSSWWSAPPLPDPSTRATTTIAFGPSTLKGVGVAPVPFPQPAGVPIDGALRPRRFTVGWSGLAVCRPQLGAMPQLGYTCARVLIIKSSVGGRGRRRR